jgi:hypothetical protein
MVSAQDFVVDPVLNAYISGLPENRKPPCGNA